MTTQSIKLYNFEDLNQKAKEKAREWCRNTNDYFGIGEILKDYITEEITEKGYNIIGSINVLFSLSNSQGDGVSFTGTIEKDGARYFLTQSDPHYLHEMTMQMEAENLQNFEEVNCEIQLEEMREIARSAEKLGYSFIEREDSDAMVDENIIENEYTFSCDGTRLDCFSEVKNHIEE